MTRQVGSEAAGVWVPNGSCRRSLLKPVLPLPAKYLSKFPWRSVLALLCSARSSHVVPGLAWPLALAALSPLQQLIWSDKPKCLVSRDWEHMVLVDQLQLVAAQISAGASSSWCSDSLLLLLQSVNSFWNKAAATVSRVICKKEWQQGKIHWGKSKFPWHCKIQKENNMAKKPGLNFCPKNLRVSKEKNISWDLKALNGLNSVFLHFLDQ